LDIKLPYKQTLNTSWRIRILCYGGTIIVMVTVIGWRQRFCDARGEGELLYWI